MKHFNASSTTIVNHALSVANISGFTMTGPTSRTNVTASVLVFRGPEARTTHPVSTELSVSNKTRTSWQQEVT
jgi:hypothetical protein